VSEVTRILSAIEQGDPHAAEQPHPLVDDEQRHARRARPRTNPLPPTLAALTPARNIAARKSIWVSRGRS
jgi:hypothetical protein